MKKYRNLILIGILCVVVVGIFVVKGQQVKGPSFLTENVVEMDIEETISATGEVVPMQLVTVGAQVSGQIEKLNVALGDQVKKGDLIAQIDSTTQQNDYDREEAKLTSYRAQLEAAEVELEIANTQYLRSQELITKSATSRSDLETTQKAYAQAKAEVTNLQSQIKQSEIALETAKVNLGYTQIVSPLDGTIVSVPVEVGQTVNAAMSTPTIVQIADLNYMKILMEISEADVPNVKTGMRVNYAVISEPNSTYETTLKSIDPGLTTLTNGTYVQGSNSEEAIYYYGRLEVPNSDRKLRIGMTTQNSIQIGEAKKVLAVPTIAIYEKGGKSFVKVLENDHAVEREIEIGLSNGVHTEVKRGVNRDDKIVISEMNAEELAGKNGMKGPGPGGFM